jgi:peptidoglycan/xylan/chitin deacetylase (PgdA/CDA1 family)
VTRVPDGTKKRIILNFHGIGTPSADVPEGERAYWCPRSLWPVLVDAIAEAGEQAEVPIQITFDDGNLSDVEDALPVLVERKLTAGFYVCAGRMGLPGYLTADHLRVLRDSGMGIGSHGWSHRDLRRLSDAELRQEADASRSQIGEAVGQEITEFAIPFGSYDRRVLRALTGYAKVYTSDRMRASSAGWLTPRHSYVQGWDRGHIVELITGRVSLPTYARRRAAMVYKRLR